MSMSALFADTASCARTGRALELISWSRPLPSGYSTAVTELIFPFASDTRTCTGPHRVSTASPVTVLLPAPEVPDEVEAEESELPARLEVPLVPVEPAPGAVAADGLWDFRDSNRTSPATVDRTVRIARRIGPPSKNQKFP